MATSKLARLLIGLSLTTVFSWLILRQIRFSDLGHAFSSANPGWVLAAAAAFFAGYFCRIERWRLMLSRDNPALKWSACAGPFMASFAANNVLPFRAGDVLRSFAFNKALGTSSGAVVATLIGERLLDLLMVFTLLGVALLVVDSWGVGFSSTAASLPAAGAAFVVVALFYPESISRFASWISSVIGRFAPRAEQKIRGEVEKGINTVRHFTGGRMMVRLVSWSLLAWLAEGCVYWFSALALPALTEPSASWVALPVGTLATLIPSTPGYVGTFDYFTIRAMSASGNTIAAATAFALLVHALLWIPATVLGGLYFLFRK